MLLCKKETRNESYQVNIQLLDHQYEIAVKLMKTDKSELLTVDNPRYEEVIDQYPHLKGVTITEHDKRTSSASTHCIRQW